MVVVVLVVEVVEVVMVGVVVAGDRFQRSIIMIYTNISHGEGRRPGGGGKYTC